MRPAGNTSYTAEFKTMVVEEYLSGKGSAVDLAAKHKISTADVLLHWVSLYNANRKLKEYNPKREVYMAEARRKTTLEERKEIVEYCISHDRNYKETASLYDVSYSQVYSWVKKYDADGETGLSDRRLGITKQMMKWMNWNGCAGKIYGSNASLKKRIWL